MFFKKKLNSNINKMEIVNFSELDYLEANPEIKVNIKEGDFENLKIYLLREGWKNLSRGKEKFHKDFEPFKEERYLELFPDIAEAVSRGDFQSGFEHFSLFGYREILEGQREWNKITLSLEEKSDTADEEMTKKEEKYFAYLDRLSGLKIIGWAGTEEDKCVEVEVFINGVFVSKVIPNISRVDVQSIEKYRYCKGMECTLSPQIVSDILKNTISNEVEISLIINKEPMAQPFYFSSKEWLSSLAKAYHKSDFLQYLPLFGTGFEKQMTISQLIDVILDYQAYGLEDTLADIFDQIIIALGELTIENEAEKEKLFVLLCEHQDIVRQLLTSPFIEKNLSLFGLLQKVLHSIPPQDAQQIVTVIDEEKKHLLNLEKIEKVLAQEEEIFYLSQHPDEILVRWKHFNQEERIKKATAFLNLYVFLQDFEALAKLEIGREELNEIFSLGENLDILSLQKRLFERGAFWDALLLTVYLISSGVKPYQKLDLIGTFIEHLKLFEYINAPMLSWIFVDTLFIDETIDFLQIRTMMEKFQEAVDDKALWYDLLIKNIFNIYLNKTIKYDYFNFDVIYKYCMKHYLFDKDIFIEKNYLTERYFDRQHLAWLKHIEILRVEALKLMEQNTISLELLEVIRTIEYLSPKIVNKITYDYCSNIFNLSKNREHQAQAAYRMLSVGGTYDKLYASKILSDDALYSLNETVLIKNTIEKKSESPNNYWYKKALLVRPLGEEERFNFLIELYEYITTEKHTERVALNRLIRLFYSELLWNLEKGIKIEDFQIKGKSLNILAQTLNQIDEDSEGFYQLFKIYLHLSSQSSLEEKVSFNKIVGEKIDFDTKERMKEILKGKEQLFPKEGIVLMKQAMLFPYTLVMVYSCQAYIPTRQKSIRETWMQRAQELGIALVFVVGGSKTSYQEGDMVYLSVEDTYERLPQKSVEMFRFVSEHFSYDRFMKIDDDCFVNIDAYFSDDALFNTGYYGRVLHRGIGDMDRAWHQKKSKELYAQTALDLSPEPSTYADGSTGYVLSSEVCRKLVKAYQSTTNTTLVKSSFMEDKLVGDLLATEDIWVDSTNFASVIYRKITDEDEATFWEYNLLPKCTNHVKILHCETSTFLHKVWSQYLEKVPYNTLQQRYFSNTPIENFKTWGYNERPFIEAITIDSQKIEDAKHIGLLVCKNEKEYLPMLLEHHRSIGIEHFIYIDNLSTDGSLEYMLEQKDVSVFISTQEYKNSRFGVNWMEAALSNFCIGKWVLVIDADEFFVYDSYESKPISFLTEYAEAYGFDAFHAPMIDMYSRNKIAEATLDTSVKPYQICNYFDAISTMNIQRKCTYGPFSNAPVYSFGLRGRIFGQYNPAPDYSYLNQKYCLFKYKPIHKFIEGIHFMGNHHPVPLRVGLLHFKYHAGFYDKVTKQIESGQHWNGSAEYKRYLDTLQNNKDLSFFDEENSLEYTGSKSLIDAGYIDPFPSLKKDK